MGLMDQAIDDLYAAFFDVAKPNKIDTCPCCFDDNELDHLLTKARRLLTHDDLNRYTHKAISTAGSPGDYLYFFPRIVELAVADQGWWDWQIIFDKIAPAAPETWPATRRSGLEAFLLTALESISRGQAEPLSFSITELVCCVGLCGIDPEPWLEELLGHPALLAQYYEDDVDTRYPGRLRNAFWGNSSTIDVDRLAPNHPYRETHARHLAAQARIVEWLQSDAVLNVLTNPT